MHSAGRWLMGAALLAMAVPAGAQQTPQPRPASTARGYPPRQPVRAQPARQPAQAQPARYPTRAQPARQRARTQQPPQPKAESSAKPSCTDGVHNGIESDIDCGGNCQHCDIGQRCYAARDCISGRCGAGECLERPLLPDEPVPPGYETQLSRSDAAASTRMAGLWFFVAGYSAAYVGALSLPGKLAALQIPVVGPWLTLGDIELPAGKVLLTIDGALQGAGAVLLVGGLVGAGRQLVRTKAQTARVHLAPQLGPDRYGLGVFGSF